MEPTEPGDLIDEVLFVFRGANKGRICYCDEAEGKTLLVYFGSFLLMWRQATPIPFRSARVATMNDLVTRYQEIRNELGKKNFEDDSEWLYRHEAKYLYELDLVVSELWARDTMARFSKVKEGKRLYLAHSSLDKGYVRQLYADLKRLGHDPWLDELEIRVGESIVEKINHGISSADFLILMMSENAVKSGWVKSEWQTKYWEEISSGNTKILVCVISDCELPELLRIKKYADFRESYEVGLSQLLEAIGHPRRNQEVLSLS